MELQLTNKINEYQESIHKPLKESSVKLFVRSIKNLRSKMGLEEPWDTIDFLKDKSKVDDALQGLSPNTIRNYYSAIIIVLSAYQQFPEISKEYEVHRDQLNDDYNEGKMKGIVSQNQGDNFISFDDLTKLYNEIYKDVKPTLKKINKKEFETISLKDKQLLQIYVLLTLYRKYPFRNETAELDIISTKEFTKLKEEDKVDKNYLITGKEYRFSMNSYKTNRKYKEKIIDIDKDTKNLLKKWIKLHPGEVHLFTTQSSGKQLTRNELGKMLRKYFKETIGKSISSTILAKSLYSDTMPAEQLDKIKKLASIRGHTLDTALNIYVIPKK